MSTVARRVASLLDQTTNKEDRYYTNFQELKEVLDELRSVGKKIVLTQGVYDLLHVGHAQYLEKARTYGDVLVVGVDSDELTRKRKGDGRPIVPEDERVNILLHLRHVDIVVLRGVDQELETLIKTIKPDVYIASESTKDFSVDKELAAHCGEVHTLPPQAVTSTTARVRQVSLLGADELAEELAKQIPEIVRGMLDKIKKS
jgi:D-beta-D-heptose 7-phosphate kinase/D-beta-D-heptose 1-phosphate adenosyltransferase